MDAVNQETRKEENISFPEPPENLRSRRFSFITALKYFGPGAIVASLTIGSGETVFASRTGAVFGYAMLWALVVGAITKASLNYASNRYMIITGEHPMSRLAKVIPGPRGWFPIFIGVLAIASFPSFSGGLSVAIGDYLQTLGAGNSTVWAIGFLLVCGALAFLGGYSWLERAQVAIVGVLMLLVLAAVFVAGPDWGGVLGGFVPRFPEYDAFVAQEYPDIAARSVWVEVVVFLGALGGGMYDYIGYTGLMREKRWGLLGHREIDEIQDRVYNLGPNQQVPLSERPDDVANGRAWNRAPLGDVIFSWIAITIFGVAFMINGANILNEAQLVPSENRVLNYQSEFLGAISPILEGFYVVAIILVFFGTIYALWEVYLWTTYESLAAVSERVRRAGVARLRPWVYLYVAIGGLILIFTPFSLVALVTPASIVAGIFAGGLYCAGILYAERVSLPQQYRLSTTGRVLLIFAAIVLSVSGLIAFIQYWGLVG